LSKLSKPSVLLVGQGAPTTGGIPTFIGKLLEDPWLRQQIDLVHLNTTPRGEKRPAAFHFSNVWYSARDAIAVFSEARGKEVVHFNLAPAPTLPLLRAIVLCLAAKLAGARVVLHAHTGRLDKCLRFTAYRTLFKAGRRSFDTLVVVSTVAASSVHALGVNVEFVPNGVDVHDIPAGPKRNDVPVMVFVGTVCERKGLLDLRDALLALRRNGFDLENRLRVLIVGDSKQEGPGVFDRVKDSFAAAGLSAVEFTGSVARHEVIHILGGADIFCLPSHWEGSPLSLLEAMAAEMAVVATSVGQVPDVLDYGRAGMIVPPHSPVELARAIKRLISDSTLRKRLGRAARSRVEKEYGLEKRLHALYLDVAGYSM
jgi:glycosyltransferase involved in cell wall biosynthesis